MEYAQHQTGDEVTLDPAEPAVASVVLLHGLGADGRDLVPIAGELDLPLPVRFVFPNAPPRPVTINGGYVMPAWYDIKAFTPEGRADAVGLAESTRRVNAYLDAEIARGVEPSRVVLAGFSQGGAVALTAGLRFPKRLAGVLALSSYLPFPGRLRAEQSAANSGLPVMMCHGRMDPVVSISMGIEARDQLAELGYTVEWHEYPMEHEVCGAELADVGRWLTRMLTVRHTDRPRP